MENKEEKDDFNVIIDIENFRNYLENKEILNIVQLVCKRSNSQRQKTKETYYSTYGKDLKEELNSKLSGNVNDLVMGLMMTPEEFDANEIHLAIKGIGTDESRLSEIIATRPSRHLTQIKDKFSALHGETMDKAIIGDTSKCYQKLLVAIIQGKRSDNPYPDPEKMKEILEKLKLDEKGKMPEDAFVQYLGSCSYAEICTLCWLFEKTYNKSILEVIKNSFDKSTHEFFKILFHFISDCPGYFAEKLHGFKEKDLTRILISRSEINMNEIREAYKELYNSELLDDLKTKTSGNYQIGLTILAQK